MELETEYCDHYEYDYTDYQEHEHSHDEAIKDLEFCQPEVTQGIYKDLFILSNLFRCIIQLE